MSNENSSGSSLGLGTILFIIFLVLKLCDVIDWSWWWVTAPIWIPVVAIGILLLFSYWISNK
jgi:hypothetical protein